MVGMGNERDVDVAYIGDSKLDDAVVVQIDTGERSKRTRVMLNEAVLFDGDPEHGSIDAAKRMITAELMRGTDTDTLERSQTRIQLVFDMFYDDEEGEPDQAIRDLLTDLMHVAAERGVDMEDAVTRAASMFSQEREEWSERDED